MLNLKRYQQMKLLYSLSTKQHCTINVLLLLYNVNLVPGNVVYSISVFTTEKEGFSTEYCFFLLVCPLPESVVSGCGDQEGRGPGERGQGYHGAVRPRFQLPHYVTVERVPHLVQALTDRLYMFWTNTNSKGLRVSHGIPCQY